MAKFRFKQSYPGDYQQNRIILGLILRQPGKIRTFLKIYLLNSEEATEIGDLPTQWQGEWVDSGASLPMVINALCFREATELGLRNFSSPVRYSNVNNLDKELDRAFAIKVLLLP
ncbi:hypothetical protein [Moorena bouillonii]|uniref:Uncharacterized protein n=1 Tax=Moorena bouillonii PNG TaxID=568701 RepID=A0A1U7N6K5_9CYAN|nr:hypothetical protein [Moorena bouillonii]OLT61578.1 hypothetical protein BJP37_23735 [Moorena bouillonii PNG]